MTKMRRTLAMAAAAVLSVTALRAQEGMRQPGPSGGPPYDVSAEKKVSGTIVQTYTIPAGVGDMMIAEITTSGGPLQLIMGPGSEVQKLKFPFTKNLKVDVWGLGDRQVNGQPAMLIRKMVAANATLTLRDEKGKPVWVK